MLVFISLLVGRKVSDEPATVLAQKALILPIIFLNNTIIGIGSKRYPKAGVPKATTDGGREDSTMQKQHSILTNTVEQFIMHLLSLFAFAAVVPHEWRVLAPALCFLWTLARVSFVQGYMHDGANNLLRAHGFAMTFFCSLIPLVYVASKCVLGLELLPSEIPEIF